MGKGGTALGIIGIILAAGAIGFGFFVWMGQNTTNSDLDDLTEEYNNLTNMLNDLNSDFNNLTQTILVGVWNKLYRNLDYAPYTFVDYWRFEFRDSPFNNTDYVSFSNSNTRITLLTSGWYRIHISVLLVDIDAGEDYIIRLLKDGALEFIMYAHNEPAPLDSTSHYIDSSAFIYSNGTTYIELIGVSTLDDFDITSNQVYNQFRIEYVTT